MSTINQKKLSTLFSFGKNHYSLIMVGGLICLIYLIAFHEIIFWIARGWFTFNDSYSILIIVISIYMVWLNKDHLIKLQIKPNLFFGTGLTILGCLLLVFGKLSSTLVFQGVALVLTLLGLVLLILGRRFFSVLFIPVGYLLLMFSLVEELLGNASIYFQNVTAWIAAHLLGVYGMPVFLSERFIELPHISLEVAKVCNGINHIVALVALAIPLAVMRQRSMWQKILYVFFAFIIGIFANGLRVALIGIWTLYNKNPDSIHGPFELFYVSFIVIFGLGLLIIPSLFGGRKIESKTDVKIEKPVKSNTFQNSNKLQVLPAVIACIILFLTSLYIYGYKPMPVYLARPLESFPKVIGQWHGEDVNDKDWPFQKHIADAKLKRIYRNNSNYEIGLYISYYYSQNQEQEIITDRLNWLYNRAEDQPINLDSKTVNIKKGLPRGLPDQTYQGDNRSFYFWYEISSKILTGRYTTKLVTLLNSFLKRKSNGAMVIVTVNDKWNQNKEANDIAVKFIQTAFPIIQEHLKTIE